MGEALDLARERRLRDIDRRLRKALALVEPGRTVAMLHGELPCPELEGETMTERTVGRPRKYGGPDDEPLRVQVRLERDFLARIDKAGQRMGELLPGPVLSRSDVIRGLILRGLDAFEADAK